MNDRETSGEAGAEGARRDDDEARRIAGRRRVLQLGSVAAISAVTIRPALASTAASVLTCEIPVPDPRHSGQYIDMDGRLVSPDTPGAFRPSPTPFKGEDVKNAMRHGRSLPGTTPDQSQAYTNYIRRLQQGTSGFTCYASLQMPR